MVVAVVAVDAIDQLNSPFGKLLVEVDNGLLAGLWFNRTSTLPAIQSGRSELIISLASVGRNQVGSGTHYADHRLLGETSNQLQQYFTGQRRQFDLPIRLIGTPFQIRVWQALLTVPFGQTLNYGQLASRVNRPIAYRAVAQACAANPIPIIVPCHRIVAKNDLGGYAGGLDKKIWLLEHENT